MNITQVQPEEIPFDGDVTVTMPREIYEVLVMPGSTISKRHLIKLVERSDVNETVDRFEIIYNRQAELMKRFGIHPDQLKRYMYGSLGDCILKVVYATIREVIEIGDELPWKWWHKPGKINWEKLRVEVIDLMHFVFELAIMVGMNSEEIFNAYIKKNDENISRMDKSIENSGKYLS